MAGEAQAAALPLSKGSRVEVRISNKDSSKGFRWELGQVVQRHSKPPLSSSTRKGRTKIPAITFDVKMNSTGKILRKLTSKRVRAVSVKKIKKPTRVSSAVDGLKKAGLTFGAIVELQLLVESEQSDTGNQKGAGDESTEAPKKGNSATVEDKTTIAEGGNAVEDDENGSGAKKVKEEDNEHESDNSSSAPPSIRRGRVVRASSDGKCLDIVMGDCSLRLQVPRKQVHQHLSIDFRSLL